jgi:hypothetical protein
MLNSHQSASIQEVLQALNLREEPPVITQRLESYFAYFDGDGTTLETLLVTAGEKQTATVASSKLSNLQFRIKDLFLETLKTTVKLQSAKSNWLAMALIVLEFLQKASGMLEYKLSADDAQILLEMYRLENERVKITVEHLFSGLKASLTQNQILQSLDLLEKLACIRYGLDQINLVETIIFVQE